LIWQALFSLESLLKYSLQYHQLEHELEMLQQMKTEPLPESEIESINNDISGLTVQISQAEVAIDYLTRSYIATIQNSETFSLDSLERQMDRLFQNRILDENLRANLDDRVQVFRKHIALHMAKPQSIQPETIIRDVLSRLAPDRLNGTD
jgi:hypothetical protein